MALIILEGLDRTGKSSVARHFESQGFEVIHMSAPAKGVGNSEYLDDMVQILTSVAGRNVVLDRSHYGELVWPGVYNRDPKLTEEDFEVLRELEEQLDCTRILMHDPNSEAHWQRCVDNNEPLTKTQFVKARALYSSMADKYGFVRRTLKDFPDADQPLPPTSQAKPNPSDPASAAGSAAGVSGATGNNKSGSDQVKTKEQLKLERANVINEVLDKRIIKGKGPMYDEIERGIRTHLNSELGKIFGNAPAKTDIFSTEEVELLKFFCKKLKEKE
jgi:hypothetical protein